MRALKFKISAIKVTKNPAITARTKVLNEAVMNLLEKKLSISMVQLISSNTGTINPINMGVRQKNDAPKLCSPSNLVLDKGSIFLGC